MTRAEEDPFVLVQLESIWQLFFSVAHSSMSRRGERNFLVGTVPNLTQDQVLDLNPIH